MTDSEEDADTQLSQHKQSTAVLISALEKFERYDFENKMGSGIHIRLVGLDNRPIVEEFTVRAEDMEQIKVPIIESLRKTLQMRVVIRNAEIKDIKTALERTVA